MHLRISPAFSKLWIGVPLGGFRSNINYFCSHPQLPISLIKLRWWPTRGRQKAELCQLMYRGLESLSKVASNRQGQKIFVKISKQVATPSLFASVYYHPCFLQMWIFALGETLKRATLTSHAATSRLSAELCQVLTDMTRLQVTSRASLMHLLDVSVLGIKMGLWQSSFCKGRSIRGRPQ